jgi:hypothetical protein
MLVMTCVSLIIYKYHTVVYTGPGNWSFSEKTMQKHKIHTKFTKLSVSSLSIGTSIVWIHNIIAFLNTRPKCEPSARADPAETITECRRNLT